jgi:RNA polymerase sigma factor (sigma-70 family)
MPLDPGAEPSPTPPDWSLLEEALPHLERVVAFLRHRHRLSREEAEDFQSWAQERLIEDDCRRLRAFSGRSKLSTFLATVLSRLLVDYRRREWGPRWTPSAVAERLGPLAVRLEELWHREGLSYAEAAEWLAVHAGADRAELEAVARQLPPRHLVRTESVAEVPETTAEAPDPEAAVLAAERAEGFERLRAALVRRLVDLPAEDASILRLHYVEGMSMAAISQALHLDQRPMYRRRDRLLARLRAELVRGGLSEIEAKRLLDEWRPEDRSWVRAEDRA